MWSFTPWYYQAKSSCSKAFFSKSAPTIIWFLAWINAVRYGESPHTHHGADHRPRPWRLKYPTVLETLFHSANISWFSELGSFYGMTSWDVKFALGLCKYSFRKKNWRGIEWRWSQGAATSSSYSNSTIFSPMQKCPKLKLCDWFAWIKDKMT